MDILEKPEKYCLDCGPTPVSHAMSFASSLIVVPLTPLGLAFPSFKRLLARLAVRLQRDRILRGIFFLLARFRLGRIAPHPHSRLSDRAKMLWQEAERRGIQCWEFLPFGRSIELFVAEQRGDITVFQALPRPIGGYRPSIEWMDDKHLARVRLRRACVPFPRGGTATSYARARQLFSRVSPPVVVKPRLGSRGRHAHVHIGTEDELRRAYVSARRLSPWVIVEEELQGEVYRILLIEGRMVAVARRNYPRVTGDGTRTIRALVDDENRNPLRHGSVFHPLPVNDTTRRYLSSTGRKWEDVPRAGDAVYLDRGVIRERGGLTEDVTDDVHPENRRLFERIARIVGDPLIGVDFITQDMSRPWEAQTLTGVIELNALPFIDLHHYCVKGTPRNAAGNIWDMVFPP